MSIKRHDAAVLEKLPGNYPKLFYLYNCQSLTGLVAGGSVLWEKSLWCHFPISHCVSSPQPGPGICSQLEVGRCWQHLLLLQWGENNLDPSTNRFVAWIDMIFTVICNCVVIVADSFHSTFCDEIFLDSIIFLLFHNIIFLSVLCGPAHDKKWSVFHPSVAGSHQLAISANWLSDRDEWEWYDKKTWENKIAFV